MPAEGAAAETHDRAGGMLAHAREAVSGAVHGAEEKAKWAVQHTKGECVGSLLEEASLVLEVVPAGPSHLKWYQLG